MELVVGGYKVWRIGNGQPQHIKSLVVAKELLFGLERILRTYHQPHFVHSRLGKKRLGQRNVAKVWGIERSAEDSYAPCLRHTSICLRTR